MYPKVVLLQKPQEVKIIFDFVFPISKDQLKIKYKSRSCTTKVCQYKYKIKLFLSFCNSNYVLNWS